MKIVVLTGDVPSQAALCRKLAAVCDVAAVVLSQNVPRKPPAHRARLFANRIAGRTVGWPLTSAWHGLQRHYADRGATFSSGELVRVRNVNDPATLATLERHQPDLVVVSGTNLVGRSLIERAGARLGFVNLHTGISPYVKGGPNCTNWCLAEGWFHLIGSTVMWLDPGIDTGAIIATAQAPLDGRESLSELHVRVMEHAHDLYVRAVGCIAAGKEVARVPQDGIAAGRTFYTVEWNALAMARALLHFRRDYRPSAFGDDHRRKTAALRLIPLPE